MKVHVHQTLNINKCESIRVACEVLKEKLNELVDLPKGADGWLIRDEKIVTYMLDGHNGAKFGEELMRNLTEDEKAIHRTIDLLEF